MHNIAIVGLVGSTVGLAVTNVVDAAVAGGFIQTGTALSTLGVPALLGVIAVASVYGLVKVFMIYKEAMEKNNTELSNLIKANTEAISKLTTNIENQNKSVERMETQVAQCVKNK